MESKPVLSSILALSAFYLQDESSDNHRQKAIGFLRRLDCKDSRAVTSALATTLLLLQHSVNHSVSLVSYKADLIRYYTEVCMHSGAHTLKALADC